MTGGALAAIAAAAARRRGRDDGALTLKSCGLRACAAHDCALAGGHLTVGRTRQRRAHRARIEVVAAAEGRHTRAVAPRVRHVAPVRHFRLIIVELCLKRQPGHGWMSLPEIRASVKLDPAEFLEKLENDPRRRRASTTRRTSTSNTRRRHRARRRRRRARACYRAAIAANRAARSGVHSVFNVRKNDVAQRDLKPLSGFIELHPAAQGAVRRRVVVARRTGSASKP